MRAGGLIPDALLDRLVSGVNLVPGTLRDQLGSDVKLLVFLRHFECMFYFRIFNPVAQGRRWDPDGRYVRRWLPELRTVRNAHVHAPWEAGRPPADYPAPIVDHAERREIALERFRSARGDRVVQS